MIGAAHGTGRLPLKKGVLLKTIREMVPERYLDENIKALEAGSRVVRKGKGKG